MWTLTNQNIDEQFSNIAKELFFEYSLIVNEQVYQLVEVEFYYHSSEHADPFVHCDEMQKTNGQWYFHGSGIDITFGNKEGNYGGILIRGIAKKNDDNYEYISGPLNVAKEIFSQLGSAKIQMMNFGLQKLSEKKQFDSHDFVASSRINLPQSKSNNKYFNSNYRYVTHLNSKHRFAEKTKVAKQLFKQVGKAEVVNSKFGYNIVKLP